VIASLIVATIVIIMLVVFFVVAKASKGGAIGGSYASLSRRGTPGLGILLQVDSTGLSALGTSSFLPLEKRTVTIDVEVPGQAPYVANLDVVFPTSLRGDVLPGATVEVRVDPKNAQNLCIIGPGVGFTGVFPPRAS
jgi:hypothetical protein